MDPVAFHLGPLTIRWYGIMVASGFMAGYLLIQARCSRFGVSKDVAGDLAFAALLGGLVGARVLYVIEFWGQQFRGHFLEIFKIYHGGLVFYGGLIGAVAVVLFWGWRKHWSFAAIGDLAAPALPLGHALGRVGCFLNGCCFGLPYNGPLAVTYPGITAGGYLNGPLEVQRLKGIVPADAVTCHAVFPIQLVASLSNLTICGTLLLLERRRCCEGRRFPLYVMLYTVARFIIEFWRGDNTFYYAGLSPAQLVCVVLFPAGLVWFLLSARKAKVRSPSSQA